eukprot:TRINITY_DN16644_c0_g1_i6.p2 TRINITY_DN16644_c0_g1~~TRINITY_DN16644_c0_g1_i6.p2  ORF type:complete len:176 (+),score=24.39 TRINITY_DN16644_c0_g1_i6:181-708(+)
MCIRDRYQRRVHGVLGFDNANSSEINPNTKYPVIDLMNDQKDIENLGGTMRLGKYPCKLEKNTNSYEVYQKEDINERHRHRYEFNNKYREQIEKAGMKIVGTSPDNRLVEIVEVPNHPWYVAVQFHPELKSRPNKPHPLFIGFIKAAVEKNKQNTIQAQSKKQQTSVLAYLVSYI